MKGNHLTRCVVGAGAAVALLLAFGVQAGTLVFLAAALACPLMMVVMMRGMMGGTGHSGTGHPGGHPDHPDQPDQRHEQSVDRDTAERTR